MKKLLLCTAIAASFGLAGCGGGGGDDLSTVQAETPVDKPFARILFNPGDSELNVPNDLLLLPNTSLFDFTIETEDATNFNPGDPQQALGGLDGWSTQHPFNIIVNMPANLTIDSSSLADPGSIRLFEATQALEGTSAPCQALAAAAAAPGLPCEVGTELTLGVDFVTTVSAPGVISVIPLSPLKPGQGYLLAVTESLKDSDGRAVLGSTTWELARQDIDELPLATPDQLQLQQLVDVIMDAAETTGMNRESISYAAYFSTQSAGTITGTVKQLQVGPFAQAVAAALQGGADLATAQAQAAQFLPVVLANESALGDSVFDVLAPQLLTAEQLAGLTAAGIATCDAMVAVLADPSDPRYATVAATFPSVAQFCAADLKAGSVNLPYYLSTTNPLGDWWRAACTNGAMLQALGAETVGGLIANGAVGPNNALCQAASGGQLFDLNLAAIGIDDARHLTKVNPIPVAQGSNPDGTETLDVQITVPNETVLGLIAAIDPTFTAVSKPDAGWPVVILQHGITSKKEDFLAVTGALALAGFASVAIDHPLHGSRGITLEDETIVNASNGFGGSPTDYLNLASLLTARDNLRQSIVDTMGLRLGLNAVVDLTGGSIDLDGGTVSFLGQSLGSITGIGSVANANTTLGGDLAAFDQLYTIKAAGLSVPGGGIASFLLESAAFGPLVKASLAAQASTDFQQALGAYAQANGVSVAEALVPAWLEFEAGLNAVQAAELNASVFAPFAFAAQTVIDSADPNNYAARLAANTPVLLHEVVGGGTNNDGSTALSDQVIPNTAAVPLAGTEGLISIMGLDSISTTTAGAEPVSGAVRFIAGSHGSLLDPSVSLAATTEMQRQVATYFATMGTAVVVTDTSVVAN
ncbi:MAG: VolA/Pla-1 family phospholipase [Aestuariibacter sp.]